MNTFQLTCFLAVANSLNFARAAEHLNVSQPTITHQIKALEDELNVKLFRRSTRLVELTPEGLAFITDAKNMVGIAEQAKRKFSNHTERKIDTISIGLSNYALFDLLSEALKELVCEFPNLHPKLHIVPHEQLFHLLETGSVDVIFGIRESGEVQEKLKYKELALSSLVGVCRNDDPLAESKQITFDSLKKEKLIFCDPFSLSIDIAKLQMKLAAEKDPADIYWCSSSAATFVLVSAGMGIAVIPELFIPQAHHISKIEIEDAPMVSYGMFYNSYSDNEILKRFTQAATSSFFKNHQSSIAI